MTDLTDFRRYYNQTIQPQLLRLEVLRKRIESYILLSFVFVLSALLTIIFFHSVLPTLLLAAVCVVLLVFAYREFQIYRADFKPKIINLVLDFIDNDVNFAIPMTYYADASISPEVFDNSKIFQHFDEDFIGEDYISGDSGELYFEMSELTVHEMSPVRNRLDKVFNGVFLHALYTRSIQEKGGEILIIPKEYKQYATRSIKLFARNGAQQLNLKFPPFNDRFIVFANKYANVKNILNEDMQRAIHKYSEIESKELYLSFIENDIYIAVSQEHDMFEPNLWRNNANFKLIKMFYTDIIALLSILRDIDANN